MIVEDLDEQHLYMLIKIRKIVKGGREIIEV